MNSNKLTTVFLALVLTSACAGCSDKKNNSGSENSGVINVSPKSIVFEWQSLYEQKLNEFAGSENFSEIAQKGLEESRFDLFDLNSDGTPELLISADNNHKTQCEIFTVSDGQVVSVGSIGEYGAFTYYPDFKLINDEYSGEGFVVGKFINFDGTALRDYFSYSDNSGSASKGASIKHEINGEELSLPEYDEAMEVYRNARTISVGRKYSFGSATIDYALHCSESWGAVLTPTEKQLFAEQLKNNLAKANELGKDACFELCDLNGDEVPELIVSEGTSDGDLCRIYYISNNVLLELEGSYGYNGRLNFDNEQIVFYTTGANSGNACWSLTSNDISSFNVSRSHMECGRKYILTEENINYITSF
ncbi:MAG: hypothetical protein NC177_03160 [Ruminococcus flavefaciens]|nr:hypothetical protein [Ruminococcus flavefaciens]